MLPERFKKHREIPRKAEIRNNYFAAVPFCSKNAELASSFLLGASASLAQTYFHNAWESPYLKWSFKVSNFITVI